MCSRPSCRMGGLNLPLIVQGKLIEKENIIIDAKSGVSGAGMVDSALLLA